MGRKICAVNLKIIFISTLVGGVISSLVKSGIEVNMPPRVFGEVSPPAANIDAWLGFLGVSSHSLDYSYQGFVIPGAVMIYHWAFSFFFAFIYILLSVWFPKVRVWYGASYGLIVTVIMHGILIPVLGFRKPIYLNGSIGWLWNLNSYELWSEIIGHVFWSMSIEVSLVAILALYLKPPRGYWA
ncbi:DUF1440 domain-containing protein [Vibrio cholerae]